MDRIDAMSVLVAAVDQGSFSAASRHLKMPLATVSRKVSDLEAHLNTRLVNRTSRRLTLTDSGRSYLDVAETVRTSTATVTRVAHWLRHGAGGYTLALERTARRRER